MWHLRRPDLVTIQKYLSTSIMRSLLCCSFPHFYWSMSGLLQHKLLIMSLYVHVEVLAQWGWAKSSCSLMGRLAGVRKWGLNWEHLHRVSAFGRATATTSFTPGHVLIAARLPPKLLILQSHNKGSCNKPRVTLQGKKRVNEHSFAWYCLCGDLNPSVKMCLMFKLLSSHSLVLHTWWLYYWNAKYLSLSPWCKINISYLQ